MNLTTEQIQAILDGAPDGMNHIGVYQGDIVPMPNSCGDVHNLSDLREILTLRQEVERLKREVLRSIGNMEYAAFNLCESMKLNSNNGGRIVETTCPEKSLLIAIRDLKEATGAG